MLVPIDFVATMWYTVATVKERTGKGRKGKIVMKYNKSEIFKSAWTLRKSDNSLSFGECLRRAWAKAKAAVKTIKEVIMRGSEKQIKWAEDIKARAIEAAGMIVRNAERAEARNDPKDRYYISSEVARELEQMVIAGFEQMDSAADIINIRDRFTFSALEKMARNATQYNLRAN